MRWLRNLSSSNASDDHQNYRGIVSRFGASKYSRHWNLRNLSERQRPAPPLAIWSDSAPDRALPLPLPEVPPTPNSLQPRERISTSTSSSNSGSGDRDRPLPSPKSWRGRPGGKGDDEDRDRTAPAHMIGGGAPIKSIFDSWEKQKKFDQVETMSPRSVSQDATGYPARSRSSFWIDVPSRSAPNSPLASPTFSPPKNGSCNLSNFHYVAPVGNRVWSAPELPSSAFMCGVPPAFFDGSTFSTESSPMHSPRMHSPRMHSPRMHSPRMHSPRMHSPRMHSPRVRSPMGAASPLHTKISLESHAARRETTGLVSVHPLPLPPGVLLPSPSTPMPVPSTSITQANTKTEAISMKDQWKKGKLIGRGTFGSVYVASNRENGALCAMKEVELFPDDPKSAECIKQLEQEIKLLSQLKHPNIVQYYGSDIVEDRLYIYLEYVHPGSINKYVREHCGAMTESIVRNFTRHILSGLAYLHSTKTIHRDIKGANLLVDSCGVVKLADFGMAKHLTGQVADLSLKGSPYWMAPEVLLSVMQKDCNSDHALAVDIWSLGCTIIEMFTGKPPWSEYEGAAAMFKVMKDTPAIPESLSYEARDFLKCCFKRSPAERPTAVMLLEHPFMKNLQHPDAPSFSQVVVGANLTDRCYTPSEQYSSKFDQFSMFPSSQNSKGKLAAESISS